MKVACKPFFKTGFLFLFFLFIKLSGQGQGRVVVNEYMAWSGCGTTSEFIELLNFGPGPMDIGCYVVTNGQFAVTIPSNTILQPGQYYVLAGQDVLPQGCGNRDSAVRVDLNWTTCNCTNKPIPVTGNGFLDDGGSANEKVVLLDRSLNVVDAVSRYATPSSSVSITTAATASCASNTFHLGQMNIRYESIDNSTGKDNSFARRVDGDCGWVKTPAISAGAPNKTKSTSSASYTFSTPSVSECQNTAGRISINVSASDVPALFPMSYILAFDKDSNGIFNNADHYIQGVDSSAPSIDIRNLAYGRYRITVASALGCNLRTFDFFIFNCYGVVLPVKLYAFTYQGQSDGHHSFECRLGGVENLGGLYLEAAGDDGIFHNVSALALPANSGTVSLQLKAPVSFQSVYRLRMIDKDGVISYSPLIRITSALPAVIRHWPNPVKDKLHVGLRAVSGGKLAYTILNGMGVAVTKGTIDVNPGPVTLTFPTAGLLAGMYYIRMEGVPLAETVSLRFIK